MGIAESGEEGQVTELWKFGIPLVRTQSSGVGLDMFRAKGREASETRDEDRIRSMRVKLPRLAGSRAKQSDEGRLQLAVQGTR